MSAKITEVLGDLVTCTVSGKLTQAELQSLQHDVVALLRDRDKIRLLIITEQFTGWEQGAWDDFSFQEENDSRIDRMAIVGEHKWEELAAAFVGKGLREFPIEYFSATETTQALRWLGKQ